MCSGLHRAVRLRFRVHSLHALSHLLQPWRMPDLPLRVLHRFHGPRHDDTRNVRRLAARCFRAIPPIRCRRTAGLHKFLLVGYALLPRHLRRLSQSPHRPLLRKEITARQRLTRPLAPHPLSRPSETTLLSRGIV